MKGLLKPPAFQFYVKEWLSDAKVMAMTPKQRGGYIQLMAICWNERCVLPDNDQQLMAMSGLNADDLEIVKGCFCPIGNPKGLTHKKLQDQWKKTQAWRQKSQKGGVNSAESRSYQSGLVPTVVEPPLNPATATAFASAIKDIVLYLNKKCGTGFKHTSGKTKSLIVARMNEGFDVDDFKKVIDVKSNQWLDDDKMAVYLRPITLFSNKFESYLNENRGRNNVAFD